MLPCRLPRSSTCACALLRTTSRMARSAVACWRSPCRLSWDSWGFAAVILADFMRADRAADPARPLDLVAVPATGQRCIGYRAPPQPHRRVVVPVSALDRYADFRQSLAQAHEVAAWPVQLTAIPAATELADHRGANRCARRQSTARLRQRLDLAVATRASRERRDPRIELEAAHTSRNCRRGSVACRKAPWVSAARLSRPVSRLSRMRCWTREIAQQFLIAVIVAIKAIETQQAQIGRQPSEMHVEHEPRLAQRTADADAPRRRARSTRTSDRPPRARRRAACA